MDYGCRSFAGRINRLIPLDIAIDQTAGETLLRVDGCAHAWRYERPLLRAAQKHFGFPIGSRSTGYALVDGRPLAEAELPARLARKRFSAFIDASTGLLRFHYRELVVQFEADVSPRHQAAFLRAHGLESLPRSGLPPRQHIVRFPDRRWQGRDLAAAALWLAEDPRVRFATPNFVSEYRLHAGSPRTASVPAGQWHLDAIGAREAWKLIPPNRPPVRIAIIDDGVEWWHPALIENIARDGQGNVLGATFTGAAVSSDARDLLPKVVNQPGAPGEDDPNDYHGTACAGVAAAHATGRCLGVAPSARIVPVKVFEGVEQLVPDEQLSRAILFAAKHADVLSCSWSTTGTQIEAAIRLATTAKAEGGMGAILVCAAGNLGRPVEPGELPAASPDAITIGASTRRGRVLPSSNRGSGVSLYAPVLDDSETPARRILTTDVAASGDGFNAGGGADDPDGIYFDGFGQTSAACAMAAGVVALMRQVQPDLTPAGASQVLFERGLMLVDGSGGRQIDAAAAVKALLQP